MVCVTNQCIYRFWMSCQNDFLTQLNANYSPNVFPLAIDIGTLNVSVQMVLLSLISLTNDKKLDLIVAGMFTWPDENLPVLPPDCPIPDTSYLPFFVNTSMLWTPGLVLINPANGESSVDLYDTAIIQQFAVSTGNTSKTTTIVNAYLFSEIVSICNTMNLKLFPFDSQTCSIMFHLPFPLPFIAFSASDSHLSAAFENDEWDVESNDLNLTAGVYVSSGFTFPAFNFTLSLTRVPYYYTLNLISPLIAMAGMVAFVFLMPCDDGEKVLLSATLVLAVFVQQQTFVGLLPVTRAEETPYLISTTSAAFYLSVASLVEAVVVQTMCILSPHSPRKITRAIDAVFRLRFRRGSSVNHAGIGGKSSATPTPTLTTVVGAEPAGGSGPGPGPGPATTTTDRATVILEELLKMKKKKKTKRKERESGEEAWNRLQYTINFVALVVYLVLLLYYVFDFFQLTSS